MDAWFHPETGAVVQLQAAHLDHDPRNNSEENLAALCQRWHDGPKQASNRKHTALRDAGQLRLNYSERRKG